MVIFLNIFEEIKFQIKKKNTADRNDYNNYFCD